MKTRIARWAFAALLLGVLLGGPSARADVPPKPQRPTWDEHPAPTPDPPPEKPLAWVLATTLLGLGGLVGAARSPRVHVRRAARRERRS